MQAMNFNFHFRNWEMDENARKFYKQSNLLLKLCSLPIIGHSDNGGVQTKLEFINEILIVLVASSIHSIRIHFQRRNWTNCVDFPKEQFGQFSQLTVRKDKVWPPMFVPLWKTEMTNDFTWWVFQFPPVLSTSSFFGSLAFKIHEY